MSNDVLISDLHLEEKNPYLADIFKNFLKDCTSSASNLYILGDFFEKWIGDDDLTSFNCMIIDSLRQATKKGLPIYFTHGNRDFLIGKKFLRMTGCQLLPDEFVANIFGTPTLLMHGDTLCTEDIKYLRFRKKSRSWLFKTIVQLYSLKKRRAIAERYREASKKHVSSTPEYIMDVTQSEVERVMKKHHVLRMVHGHTHRPAVHHFQLDGQEAARTVLGAWHEQGNALICYPDGRQNWITF
ncbi:MAG TPA: UDP-2,3-diacylglucosamine diphosphatase [Gammaproteobacteria bacterium]|nr:UDP-2,3-diacylglucosamine diphosphatase [Gammaproteobacteria bacterium]